MKIFYLAPSLNRTDGWSQYSYDVATRVDREATVEVLCHEKTGDTDIAQTCLLANPRTYFYRPHRALLDARQVARHIRERARPGEEMYIHATCEGYAMLFPFLSKSLGRQLMTTHGTYSVLPLLWRRTRMLYKWAYQRMDRVISVSYYTKRHLLAHAPFLPSEKVQVVPNGVDFREYPSTDHRQKEGGPWRIITVGGVKPRKGTAHFVRVIEKLVSDHGLNVEGVVVGKCNENDPYTKKVTQWVTEHGLTDRITFTGMIAEDELDKQYRAADLFALMSVNEGYHYEGYPLVFHEAAMRGLPCIGTVNCGAEDAVHQGVSGLLVVPYQHGQAAQIVRHVLTGKFAIDPSDCRQWARENDWQYKDLMQMYRFPSASPTDQL